MRLSEDIEKARVIKSALKIVDELSKIEMVDYDFEEFEDLVNRSKKLSKDRYWKL